MLGAMALGLACLVLVTVLPGTDGVVVAAQLAPRHQLPVDALDGVSHPHRSDVRGEHSGAGLGRRAARLPA